MFKVRTFCYKLTLLTALFLIVGCEQGGEPLPDERFLWAGYYQVAETVYDPFTGAPSTVYYNLDIEEVWGNNTEVDLLTNGGSIYGSPCFLTGNVFHPEEMSIPLNICNLSPTEHLEITGYGRISPDGCCAQIELTIDYCANGFCQREPRVLLELQKF